jgi:hypothetical protein
MRNHDQVQEEHGLPKLWLCIACALGIALSAGVVARAQAQELPVPCYPFQQHALGNWIATEISIPR